MTDLSLTEHTVVSGLDMYLNQAPFARMDSGSKILMGSVSYIIASPFFSKDMNRRVFFFMYDFIFIEF